MSTSLSDEFWGPLRRNTQARIGLGRSGDAIPTTGVLEFRLAHAMARDAVHAELDVEELASDVAGLGLGAPAVVHSQAPDRAVYLRRPDLGRVPLSLDGVKDAGADLGIVLCDGLSARAVTEHGVPMVSALMSSMPGLVFAPPVIAMQGRVALGDHIAAAMGVSTVLVLIGERPGLSVASSLGVYLTHGPRPGLTDADRNCVSNIHPPEGLGYQAAARVVAGLVLGARALGRSGVDLKDSSRAPDALPPLRDHAPLHATPSSTSP